ncbi:MAG TPA: FecR domain-containing protein [Phenylobacterium sp.]|nr:FecR domain-containing protein [Phenylobacterium sp.]
MTSRADERTRDALRDEAVAWLVRVQSDAATAEDWAALKAWLEGSDDRLAAFEAAELLSAELGELSPEIAPQVHRTAQVVPFRKRTPWRAIGAIAAAAASLAVAPILWRDYRGAETLYRSAPGSTREIALADGTRIRMDAASTLKVRLGWRTRHVELADAEATFDVAKDPNRPFLIDVGDQQVRVVGTQFNIRHYDGTFVLTVRRGVVEVRQDGRPTPIARLTVGDELRHQDGSGHTTVAKVDPNAAFAWTEGRLYCDERPLGDIVAYLNRRYATPIRVSPAAAQRRFSGVLELGDQDQLVRRLGQYLDLPTHRSEAQFTLG